MSAAHGAFPGALAGPWMLDGRDAIYGMVAGVSNAIPVGVLRGTGTVSVADKGAIGDGASHPLSEVFPTLDAARKMYPFAATLRMEMNHPEIAAIGLGDVDDERLKRAIDMVVEANGLENTPDPSAVFTDAYLPPLSERPTSVIKQ